MSCPRCNTQTEIVSEYFNYLDKCLVRDNLCTFCNSVTVESFYDDNHYKSDWIDLNV